MSALLPSCWVVSWLCWQFSPLQARPAISWSDGQLFSLQVLFAVLFFQSPLTPAYYSELHVAAPFETEVFNVVGYIGCTYIVYGGVDISNGRL